MKIYPLSQPQKIIGFTLLAVSASVSVLLVLASRESAAQFAAREHIIVTREVALQIPNVHTGVVSNSSNRKEKVIQQSSQQIIVQQAAQPEVKPAIQTTGSTAWQMGDFKTPTPKISLSEQIASYAIVELEQFPAVLPTEGQQVVFPMLSGQKIIANVQSVATNPNGDYTWSGHVDGLGDGYPVIMTYGEHSIFATITTSEGSYTMESLDGFGWLYKNPAEIELSNADSKDFIDVNDIQ